MRRPTVFTIAAALLLAAGPVAAGCSFPPPVTVPDGKSATDAEMATARKTVQGWVDRMQQYVDCLDREAAALPLEQQTEESRALNVKRHNAAVDAMSAVAAQFNAELQAFRAAGNRR
jgi:hypothetical protein